MVPFHNWLQYWRSLLLGRVIWWAHAALYGAAWVVDVPRSLCECLHIDDLFSEQFVSLLHHHELVGSVFLFICECQVGVAFRVWVVSKQNNVIHEHIVATAAEEHVGNYVSVKPKQVGQANKNIEAVWLTNGHELQMLEQNPLNHVDAWDAKNILVCYFHDIAGIAFQRVVLHLLLLQIPHSILLSERPRSTAFRYALPIAHLCFKLLVHILIYIHVAV